MRSQILTRTSLLPSRLERIVRSDPLDVQTRLHDFGFTRDDIRKICESALHGRSLTSALKPKTAEGQLKYIFGVEGLRETALRSSHVGYEVFSKSNIEGVLDAANGRKIMFQNVDQACGIDNPQPKSRIGVGKERFIADSRSPRLFPEMDEDDRRREASEAALEQAECWYVMMSVSDAGIVCCELSHVGAVTDEKFSDIYERIKVFGYGDFETTMGRKDDDPDGDAFEIKPIISKK